MRQTLIKLLLGPLLLQQGKHLRRTLPRLPEPEGEREGHRGKGPPLRLLIAGDSAAAGVGVATQAEALSGQLVTHLTEHFDVQWRLSARTGLTTAQITERLVRQADQPIDVAVISAGVNDVTGRIGTDQWMADIAALIDTLRTVHHARRIIFAPLPPMHRFPHLPQPLRSYLGLRASTFNSVLAAFTRTQPDCHVLHLPFGTDTRMMASDGFHPAAPAYALWARTVAEDISQWAKGNIPAAGTAA